MVTREGRGVREWADDGFRGLREPGQDEAGDERRVVEAEKVVDAEGEDGFDCRVTRDDGGKGTVVDGAYVAASAAVLQAQLALVQVEPAIQRHVIQDGKALARHWTIVTAIAFNCR